MTYKRKPDIQFVFPGESVKLTTRIARKRTIDWKGLKSRERGRPIAHAMSTRRGTMNSAIWVALPSARLSASSSWNSVGSISIGSGDVLDPEPRK